MSTGASLTLTFAVLAKALAFFLPFLAPLVVLIIWQWWQRRRAHRPKARRSPFSPRHRFAGEFCPMCGEPMVTDGEKKWCHRYSFCYRAR